MDYADGERPFLGVGNFQGPVIGTQREGAIDDAIILVPRKGIGLSFFAHDLSSRLHKVENRPEHAGVRPSLHPFNPANHRTPLGQVLAWIEDAVYGLLLPCQVLLRPEVDLVNVAVSKIHGTLVGVVVVLARQVRHHGPSARHNSPLRAPQRREIRLGRLRAKMIGGEGSAANFNGNRLSASGDFYKFLPLQQRTAQQEHSAGCSHHAGHLLICHGFVLIDLEKILLAISWGFTMMFGNRPRFIVERLFRKLRILTSKKSEFKYVNYPLYAICRD